MLKNIILIICPSSVLSQSALPLSYNILDKYYHLVVIYIIYYQLLDHNLTTEFAIQVAETVNKMHDEGYITEKIRNIS